MTTLLSLRVSDAAGRFDCRQRLRLASQLAGLDAEDSAALGVALGETLGHLETDPRYEEVDVAVGLAGEPGERFLVVTVTARGHDAEPLPVAASLSRLLDGYRQVVGDGGRSLTIEHRKAAPGASDGELSRAAEQLAQEIEHDAESECERQHAELVSLLNGVWRREDELRRITREIEETNRGVLALYAELDEAARQWHTTFDSISDGVCLVDRHGRIVRANDAMGRLTGIEVAAINGLRPEQLLTGAFEATEFADLAGAAVLTRRRVSTELSVDSRWLAVTLDPVESTGQNGEVASVLIISDITERKRLEEQQRLMERQEVEASQLRQHAKRMGELEKLKTDFLNLASHELRGPLSVLAGYLSMLEDGSLGDLTPGMSQVLPVMTGKMREMTILINQMLETARLDDSRLVLNQESIDLRTIAAQAVASIRPLVDGNHRLDSDLGGEPVPVVGDRNRLVTITTNLLDNALKYSPEGGEVRVAVGRDDTHAWLTVADQGIGIDAKEQERLFSRFGRVVNEDNSHIPGTGLGLYLSRELARMHGGDLTVKSARRRGSTFRLLLPVRLPGQ